MAKLNKCGRRNCKFHCPSFMQANHCEALAEVYEDDSVCPFFKLKYIRKSRGGKK